MTRVSCGIHSNTSNCVLKQFWKEDESVEGNLRLGLLPRTTFLCETYLTSAHAIKGHGCLPQQTYFSRRPKNKRIQEECIAAVRSEEMCIVYY